MSGDANAVSVADGVAHGCSSATSLGALLSQLTPEVAPEPVDSPLLETVKVSECFDGLEPIAAVRLALTRQSYVLVVADDGTLSRVRLLKPVEGAGDGNGRAARRAARAERVRDARLARENASRAEGSDGAAADDETTSAAPAGEAAVARTSVTPALDRASVGLDADDGDSEARTSSTASGRSSSGVSTSVVSGSTVSGSVAAPDDSVGTEGANGSGAADDVPTNVGAVMEAATGLRLAPGLEGPIRIEFQGAIDALAPEGGTRVGNVFGVDGSDVYQGFVEVDTQRFLDKLRNSTPIATSADDRITAVRFGPDDDPDLRFGLTIGGVQVFSQQDIDAQFNEPLLTFAVRFETEVFDPDGRGGVRPRTLVTLDVLDDFFLHDVTLTSETVDFDGRQLGLRFVGVPRIRCFSRQDESGSDCIPANARGGTIIDDGAGGTQVQLLPLSQSSVQPISVVLGETPESSDVASTGNAGDGN